MKKLFTFKELREFHRAGEQQGHGIIKGSIAPLEGLLSLVSRIQPRQEES